MAPSHQHSAYTIVGAGCFGASTALYLKRAFPEKSVTLIDRTPFPCPSAAAHDLNKVIRADYEDKVYMELALEAQSLWTSDPIFKPYYHETGILFTGTSGPGTTIVDNYIAIQGSSPATVIDTGEAKGKFDGIYRDAPWDKLGVTTCTWNPTAGWGEAENALRSVIQAAVDLGVNYVEAAVSKIFFDEGGTSLGVEIAAGDIFTSEHTILCTGARTAELLADSAPKKAELQVNSRMTAAAAIMCAFRVPQDQMHKFKNAPIIISPIGSTPGESIPPGPLGLVKCTHELSFTHKIYHEASKQTISIPPKPVTQSTWSQDIPEALKIEAELVRESIYGDWIEGLKPECYRMCWDAVTPNQDFIVSSHPHSKNLYIAGGGSFHSWKFIPNIGKYVVQMLEGKLDPILADKWAWDRSDEGAQMGMYDPARDLKDVEGYQEIDGDN